MTPGDENNVLHLYLQTMLFGEVEPRPDVISNPFAELGLSTSILAQKLHWKGQNSTLLPIA